MNVWIRRVFALGALSLASACSEIACDCIGDPRVDVASSNGEFLIRNLSPTRDATVTVVEKNSLALIDGACEQWEPRIAPNGELRVRNEDVIGFFPEATTAVVHWCTLDGGQAAESGILEVPFS